MVDRRPKLLFDALGAIDAATRFLAQKDLAAYEADLMLRSAVERQLEILGEACTRLQKEDASLAVTLPSLRLAIGLRNRIIHGYDAVDDETIWHTVNNDLAPMRDALAALLQQLDPTAT